MSRRQRQHAAGFTLVETLAAGLILALSAAALALSARQNLKALENARDYQQAAELLDEVLTKIDLIGPARLELEGPAEGIFPPPAERFRWQASIALYDQGSLYDVVVRVSWLRPDGSQGQAEIETLLHDPPGSRSGQLEWDDL